MKTIDIKKTIYEITSEYPETVDIMINLGFSSIANETVRKTAGRFMTIPEGCKKHGKDVSLVIQKFEENGFMIIK